MPEPVKSSLRAFVEGLAAGDPGPVPDELLHLARGALGRGAHRADVDELVSAFLLKTLEATQDSRAGSARELLKMTEARLRAVVRHRLRQLRAEQCSRWKLVKAIREHVQAALRLPELDVEVLPITILDQGRIRLGLIREAIAWLRAKSRPAPRTVPEVASRIMELYFPGDVHDAGLEARSVSHQEDDLIAAVDAPALAQELRDCLGPEGARPLGRRLSGATLAEIASGSKVAISTAHERIGKAVERVRVQVRRHRLRREGLEAALEVLGA